MLGRTHPATMERQLLQQMLRVRRPLPAVLWMRTAGTQPPLPVISPHKSAFVFITLGAEAQRTSSSRVTGSSVFDFNGDGAAEVVYNDECRFRIYDGKNGDVYMSEESESRTRIEYPIVADVDNDGNAEIVFSTSNESGFCSENADALYNNGIEIWGDQNDFFVPARRIWNQHSYAVTNITEDGMPPRYPPKSWLEYPNGNYNVYRSNPRTKGIAPDLVVEGVQYTSPGLGCGSLGDTINISVQIENKGDVRGGEGSVVSFVGSWSGPGLTENLYQADGTTPLTYTLPASLNAGGQHFATLEYEVSK